jgi:hypothetical protein
MVSTEPGSIEVTVNDKYSNPIAGASVTVTGDMIKSGVTDSNGKCTIDGLVAGTYKVTAEMTTTDGTDFTGTIEATTVEPGKKAVPNSAIKVGSKSDSNSNSITESNPSSNTGSNPSSNPGPTKVGPSSDTSSPDSRPNQGFVTEDSRPNEGYIIEVINSNGHNAKYALEIRPVDIDSKKTIFGATLELTDVSKQHEKKIINQDANGWFLVKNRDQDPKSGYINGDYEGVITAPGYKPYK